MVNLKYLSAFLGAILLTVITAGTAWAQSVSSAQVSGVVRDSSGGALPGADVTITKIDTGAVRIGRHAASTAPSSSRTCRSVPIS